MSRDIQLSLIETDPGQPRVYFDPAALDDLASSMGSSGLIQPVLLRPIEGGRYVIIHGERRYRAARLLGWETIAADVKDMTEDDARVVALIENIQRSDLSPIEEARAYRDRLAGGMTQTELGRRIGKTQSHIAGKLRYLGLPDPAQTALETGVITEGHAKQILRLSPGYHAIVADVVIERGLTVSQTKRAVDLFIEATRGEDPADHSNPYAPTSQDDRKLFICGAWRVLLDDARDAANAANTLEGYERVMEIAAAAGAELGEITLRWTREAGKLFNRLKNFDYKLDDEEHAMILEAVKAL